jgi:hypothetical protein
MPQNTLVACSHAKVMFNMVSKHNKYQNTSLFMVSIPMASQAVQKASLLNFPKLDSRIKRCAAHETKVNQCCYAGGKRQETNSRQLHNPTYIYNSHLISVHEQSAAISDNVPNAKLVETTYSAVLLKINSSNFVTIDHSYVCHA